MRYQISLFLIIMSLTSQLFAADWHGKKFVPEIPKAEAAKMDKQKLAFMKAMMPAFIFTAKGTFEVTGMMKMSGTYKIKGKQIVLTPTKLPNGKKPTAADLKRTLAFTVVGDYKQLEIKNGSKVTRYVRQ